MKHASDTNRQDRAQKLARREKHSSNQGDRLAFQKTRRSAVDFSHLTEEEISAERARIAYTYKKAHRRTRIFALISVLLVFGTLYAGMRYLIG